MTQITPTPVDLAWPAHAGHDIVYSEHGRLDHTLKDVIVLNLGLNERIIEANDMDQDGGMAEIDHVEFWCRDCGEVLD